MSCGHINWEIKGTERVGCGTCPDCKKMVCLSELINGDIKRSREAIQPAGIKRIERLKKHELQDVFIQILDKLDEIIDHLNKEGR